MIFGLRERTQLVKILSGDGCNKHGSLRHMTANDQNGCYCFPSRNAIKSSRFWNINQPRLFFSHRLLGCYGYEKENPGVCDSATLFRSDVVGGYGWHRAAWQGGWGAGQRPAWAPLSQTPGCLNSLHTAVCLAVEKPSLQRYTVFCRRLGLVYSLHVTWMHIMRISSLFLW